MITPVEQKILFPFDLSAQDLNHTLNQIHTKGVDYADIYCQAIESTSLSLEDGIVKEADFHIEQGFGIRAISGDQTGFAYSNDIQKSSLEKAAKAARSIASVGASMPIRLQPKNTLPTVYSSASPFTDLSHEMLMHYLHQVDALARAQDPRITQVIASVSGSHEWVLIAASDGTYAADIRPLCRLSVSVVAHLNGKRETGFFGGGGRFEISKLFKDSSWEHYAKEAVRLACLNLEAIEAPAGTMDVVLGPGWPGVLLHEAIGHGLEGDFNRKGTSAFSRLMGEMVASPICTVVDDGTLLNRRGSLSIDDEGTPTQRTVLIENGRLVGYMQDKLNARLMNTHSTGNGRRESYAHLPMPRMTNTYLLPGTHSPDEIIASVKKGLYAVNFNGGQVDITSGKYVFETSEAYLIENGKITRPVKGATLIGDGPTALKNISLLGNDLALDPGIGVCGKEGQSVPVGVGMPTALIQNLTVGGTA